MRNLATIFVGIIYCMSVNAQTNVCPDPTGVQKKVASSFHSTIMIDYNGDVKYWGDGANPAAPAGYSYVLSPAILSPSLYSGTPVAVAAGSINAGGDSTYMHQLFLLTTSGLYGWGAPNGTITSSTSGKTPIVSIALPAGVSATDVNFITASGGGIALVTKIVDGTGGKVYIKNGSSAGSSSAYTYGDGTIVFNRSWHVASTSTDTLRGITRLSYSQKAVMAQTSSGKVYAWGEQVWSGNPVSVGNQSLAQEVLLPVSGTENIFPADINVISKAYKVDSARYATEFILATNGKLYGIGEGVNGILGQGDTTDAWSWVTVKGASGGASELTGIVQISSNNAYVWSGQLYSIGALNADGQLYLWGQNSSGIIGGTAAYYSLPRIPPNFSVNNARVGYFHMGGHTTIAFLRGSNRFCYIGHLIRGSMGDGTNASAIKPAYDCINTPDAYICPPPPLLGCAIPSSNDLVASSTHATLVINGQPSVTYWGQGSSSAEGGVNVPTPRILYEYNGTPKGVAASGVNETSGATQMWVLTTEGIWGWGYSAQTINDLSGVVGLTSVSLPVAVSNISFIRSSRGGLALVTTDGKAWIKAGAASNCSPNVYGDSSTVLNSNWHKVIKTNGTDLTGITELSFAGTTALAITNTGVYIWGTNIYLGNGTGSISRNRASLMSLPADFTGTVVAKTVEIIQSGSNGAAQFLVGSNGKVYSLGADLNGVIGQGGSGELRVWTTISTLASVRKLSSNNPYANGYYSIGALTLDGTLFLWGSNKSGMLGSDTATAVSFSTPTMPPGIAPGSVAGFELGGHQAIIFPKSSNRFYFAGHSVGGSKGDNSDTGRIITFTPGAAVANCAGMVYSISGYIYNDANGISNGQIDGTGLNLLNTIPVYINLLDESGYVVGTTTPDSTGSYTFTGFPSGNYTVQVSTIMGTLFSPAPASAMPVGWIFVGDQSGSVSNMGIDGAPDGRLAIALSGSVTVAKLGLNRIPTAADVTNTNAIIAPVGSHTFEVPVLVGSDPEDQAAEASLAGRTVVISSIPVNGKLYYNGALVTAGLSIANYDPVKLTVDPNSNATVITFNYQYADAAGTNSPSAAITLNLSYASVSGNISADANGLNDPGRSLIAGNFLSAISGTPLFVSLVDPDSSGTILATVPVQPDGSYHFNNIVPAGDVQMVLHTTAGTINSGGSLTPSLPSGWANSGEQAGIIPAAGMLMPVNGIAELTVTSDVSNINFGVDQKPVSTARSYSIAQPLPGQMILLNGSLTGSPTPPDQLTGTDPEDAPAAEGLNGNTGSYSIVIKTIPLQGVLSYNGVAVTAGQVINNYAKDLLAITLNGTGYTSTVFTYAFLDAASVLSDAVSYSVTWNNALPVSLISFDVVAEGKKARLEWSSAAEQNNRGYGIEKSTDGINWVTLGFINSKAPGGASSITLNYLYYDQNAIEGNNYYRLKRTDLDNNFKYSDVKKLIIKSYALLNVTPNPATDHITVSGLTTGSMLVLTDARGETIKQIIVTRNTETIDISRLPAGLYILKLSENGRVVQSVKVLKK